MTPHVPTPHDADAPLPSPERSAELLAFILAAVNAVGNTISIAEAQDGIVREWNATFARRAQAAQAPIPDETWIKATARAIDDRVADDDTWGIGTIEGILRNGLTSLAARGAAQAPETSEPRCSLTSGRHEWGAGGNPNKCAWCNCVRIPLGGFRYEPPSPEPPAPVPTSPHSILCPSVRFPGMACNCGAVLASAQPIRSFARTRSIREREPFEPDEALPASAPSGGDDLAWAIDRVDTLQRANEVDAGKLGLKVLKGHGYPNTVMSYALDALALRIVLDALTRLKGGA